MHLDGDSSLTVPETAISPGHEAIQFNLWIRETRAAKVWRFVRIEPGTICDEWELLGACRESQDTELFRHMKGMA